MPVFKLDINQTYGGKSSKDTFVNTLHYSATETLLNAKHETFIEDVAEAYKKIILARVRILSLVSTQLASDGSAATIEPNFKVYDQDLVGTIAIADGVDPSLIDVVGNFKKKTNGGRSGALYVKGVVSELGYESSNDLNPVMKAATSIAVFTAFGTEMIAAAEAQGFKWVIPGKTDATFTSAAREVTDFVWTGLTLRQDTNNRKSVEQKERELLRQKLSEAERERKRVARDNPGSTAEQLATLIKDIVLPLIKQYGLPLIVSLLTKKPELRAIVYIVNSLPALPSGN